MFYAAKINPISFTFLTGSRNIPPDLGYKFKNVDYVNTCFRFDFIKNLLVLLFYCDSPTITVEGEPSLVYSVSDITPAGWSGLGNYVLKVVVNLRDNYIQSFKIIQDGFVYQSENILPIIDTSKLLKIAYKNSKSDYGTIKNLNFTTFVDANFEEIIPTNEMVTYQNDRGELENLRATPIEKYKLFFPLLTVNDIRRLILIFSCDSVFINNEQFRAEKTIETEHIEQSNLFSGNIDIQRVNDDYMIFADGAFSLGGAVLDISSIFLTDSLGIRILTS